jgi:hypothetical protein
LQAGNALNALKPGRTNISLGAYRTSRTCCASRASRTHRSSNAWNALYTPGATQIIVNDNNCTSDAIGRCTSDDAAINGNTH